ncbi:F-box protein At4g00755-like [Cynara cardunculus var. scolymus]|nr:F-box protein At4g00755-like [Cynara cardunculus var. scolymus]XP_024961990.1 F-box protein At4g00755-like [Cynara cardunculus var. scolymus]
METQIDFLQWLQHDMTLKILVCLDDSADLIRVSAVSRYLQNFVISNGLSRQLCMRKFPRLASIDRVVELSHNSDTDSSSDVVGHEAAERDHRAYASLFRALTAFPQTYCIADPVSASSTDNYPEESIMNTLDPRDKILHRDSYWSSKGSDDPEVPETLIYNLTANFCVITEINLHPFQALFQLDHPIYASRFVRFRMGHPKSWNEIEHDFMESQECADDKFIWTYTSEIFPVAQENRLQKFKLLEPVVCIGGFLQIELLGRVQKQAADGRYYICVVHVQAIGRQLSPAFCMEFSGPSNITSLKYDAEQFKHVMQKVSNGHNGSLSTSLLPIQPPRQLAWGNLEDLIHMVNAHENGVEYEWMEDDDFEMEMLR